MLILYLDLGHVGELGLKLSDLVLRHFTRFCGCVARTLSLIANFEMQASFAYSKSNYTF